MNEQEKAVLGLGVYTALADGETDKAEINFIGGVAREVFGSEDEDEFISIITGLLEAHGKAVEAGAVDPPAHHGHVETGFPGFAPQVFTGSMQHGCSAASRAVMPENGVAVD